MLITPHSAKALSIRLRSDTDSIKGKTALKDTLHIKKKKKDVLDAKVDYHARDSIRLDAAQRKVYLYGDASVKYQDLELKAAYIDISIDSNIAVARGVENKDSGKVIGKPEFHQGADVFYADKIRYNFKSKKGRIDEIYTKEGEGYINGKVVKKDTGGVFYMKGGRYSTCSLQYDPHFYIAATRLKVIPHDEIVTGPAMLYIEGVPTPLAIPFGFFPLTTGRRSGILIPAYGESQQQGFFLQNGGYYFGISDHVDMQLRGDIYSYGSWGLKDAITYKDRYHYSGTFNFAFADTRLPIPESPDFSNIHNFFITWQHMQDVKARPNSTFSASVNAGSSQYMTYNSYNPSAFLQNTFQSNIAYSQNFPQTPFHLSLNAEHSQNTLNHSLTISLPELTFTADRVFPAKWFEQNPSSSAWYNKISLGLSINAKNTISTYDTVAFNPNKLLQQMQNGINTTIPVSVPLQLFRYITCTFAAGVSNITYFQTTRERWLQPGADSIKTDTLQGIKNILSYNASATLTTTVYTMYTLGLKKAIQVRMVLFPSFGVSYHPDYSAASYGYYQYVNGEPATKDIRYSIFQNGIYGGPGLGKSGALNFGLATGLEMKVRERTDSGIVYKKIKLLERLGVGTSYNMAADSFNWADITISGSTTLFKKLGVNFSGTIDPYQEGPLGNDINKLVWNNNEIGRLTNADLSFTTTLTGATNSAKQQDPNKAKQQSSSGLQFTSPDQYLTYEQFHPAYYAPIEIAPWSLSLFYNLVYSKTFVPYIGNTVQTTQSITMNGSAQITKYWFCSVYTGYDLQAKQFTTTSFSAKRDMHCWELTFTTIPFGFHQSFTLEVHVKSSVLQDLKLSRTRQWEDTQQYGE